MPTQKAGRHSSTVSYNKIMKIWLSIYLSLGFILSHLLHVIAYKSQGATELATWLVHVSPVYVRSIKYSLFLAAWLSFIAFLIGLYITKTFKTEQLSKVLKNITILSRLQCKIYI